MTQTNSPPDCPICGMQNTYFDHTSWVCPDCSHEWKDLADSEEEIVTTVHKDAHGNVLNHGDTVTLIKDLKVKGSSLVIKGGTKIKNIRLVDGDHNIDCKVDGQQLLLKSEFMKKS